MHIPCLNFHLSKPVLPVKKQNYNKNNDSHNAENVKKTPCNIRKNENQKKKNHPHTKNIYKMCLTKLLKLTLEKIILIQKKILIHVLI